ncbi:MAG: ATP-dependent Clp protease adaptor ClpS [Armatimonadetes bacterium]|nr:ATP-dependent Clp protease adaptor ClpS [Armatimonadota bacterium]
MDTVAAIPLQLARTLIDAPPVAESIIQQIQDLEGERSPAYRVILFDDDEHSMDQVSLQIQKATGYSLQKAEVIMLEAHLTGQAVVYSGDFDDCNRVAGVLRQIGLQVSVEPD